MAVILGEGLYHSAIYNHLIYISRLSVLAIVTIRNIEERIKVDLLQISFQRDHWHSLFVLLQLCKQSAPIHDFDYPASLHTTEKMTNIIFTSLTRYFPGSVLKGVLLHFHSPRFPSVWYVWYTWKTTTYPLSLCGSEQIFEFLACNSHYLRLKGAFYYTFIFPVFQGFDLCDIHGKRPHNPF